MPVLDLLTQGRCKVSRMGSSNKSSCLSTLSLAAGVVCLVLAVTLIAPAGGSHATGLSATAPGLGVAASFGVLGGSEVTNTGPSIVDGDLGVWPGSAVTGFPPGTVNGTIHADDAVAQQAQSDVTTAYDDLAGQACDVDLTGQDLGGMTLTPGVYCFDSSAQLTGSLTLDAEGDSEAVWVFRIGSTLTTASNSSVSVIDGGDPCNVFWQVGSSATLGTDTAFAGNILALTSITLNTGADVDGRALARNGAVTMDTNDVSILVCGTAAPTSTPTTIPTETATAAPTETATAAPTETATAAPTETAVATPTDAPTAAPTETAVATPTDAPTAAPTETAVATPTDAPTAAPTETAVATPTDEPTATPTALSSIIPVTGGGPALDSRQLLAASLVFLGLGLVLSAFALRRKWGT